MNEDNTTTFDWEEMLFDAIYEATEEAILRGQITPTVVVEIRQATRRLRQLLRDHGVIPRRDRRDGLLDVHDLYVWERTASLQAAVLAAMLCNDVP